MDETRQVDPLAVRLMALQEWAGMTDAAFAEDVLGITKGAWSKLRNGRRQGGGRFVKRAMDVLADPASFLPASVPVEGRYRKLA